MSHEADADVTGVRIGFREHAIEDAEVVDGDVGHGNSLISRAATGGIIAGSLIPPARPRSRRLVVHSRDDGAGRKEHNAA